MSQEIARAWLGTHCQFWAATLEAMLPQIFVTLVLPFSLMLDILILTYTFCFL